MDNKDNQIECCETQCIHRELLDIVNEKLPDETELYDLSELFKVFGDSTRIRILFVINLNIFFLSEDTFPLKIKVHTKITESITDQKSIPIFSILISDVFMKK